MKYKKNIFLGTIVFLIAGCIIFIMVSKNVSNSKYDTGEGMMEQNEITIEIGDQMFSISLNNNAAAKELLDRLPLDIEMTELNNNEKYYYFTDPFSTNDSRVSQIEVGDLMIYNDHYLVLFYDRHTTSYRYTKIGEINDPTGLKDALGTSSIQVKIY